MLETVVDELLDTPTDTLTASLYVTLPPERDHNRLVFKNAIVEARGLLKQASDSQPRQALMNQLDDLQRRAELWRDNAGGGLGVFIAPGFERVVPLSDEVTNHVSVGPAFSLLPLLRERTEIARFWLLSLDVKATRLWRGDAQGIERVQMPEVAGIVLEDEAGMREVLAIDRPRHDGLASHNAGTAGTITHGHGKGDDDAKGHQRRFFQLIHDGVREALGDSTAPLLLAGIERHQTMFHDLATLPQLSTEGLKGNVTALTPTQLHARAWEAAQRLDRSTREARERWDAARFSGRVESDLSAIARLVAAGRVGHLLVEAERRIWGTLDPTLGELTLDATQEALRDPDPSLINVLDVLAAQVLRMGGEVTCLPAGQMPTEAGAGAILR